MFFHLTNSTKNIFINEIRDALSRYPKFADKVKIQGNYAFKEREQYAVVVKVSSANKYQLSMDNYIGALRSFAGLARVRQKPSTSLEWVKEDHAVVKHPKEFGRARPAEFTDIELSQYFDQLVEEGKLATPGNYWITITGKDESGNYEFLVDPIFIVKKETLANPAEGGEVSFQIEHFPMYDINNSTTRVYYNGTVALRNNQYSLDSNTGVLTWLVAGGLNRNDVLEIDYRYTGNQYGESVENNIPVPFKVREEEINNKAVPGIILAFGQRIVINDQMVVVVERDRRDVARLYGGKWTIALNLIIYAQNTTEVEELADIVAMNLWAVKRDEFIEFHGININSIDISGLEEFTEDETAMELAYTVDISIECETDWEIAIPLLIELGEISLYETNDDPNLSDEEAVQIKSSLKIVPGLPITGTKKNIEKI